MFDAAVNGNVAWVGWTMATTPPLKPIEEITNQDKDDHQSQRNNLKTQKLSVTILFSF